MAGHNKLVRDRVPEIIEASGGVANTRILENDAEYLDALLDKQVEEALELRENPTLGEIVDCSEVLDFIKKASGYTPEEVEVAKEQKARERGQFKKRILLISTD